jgi:hypothetical protein
MRDSQGIPVWHTRGAQKASSYLLNGLFGLIHLPLFPFFAQIFKKRLKHLGVKRMIFGVTKL